MKCDIEKAESCRLIPARCRAHYLSVSYNIILLLTFLVVGTSQVKSQEQIYDQTPVWKSLEWVGPYGTGGVTFGDADCDGMLDMLLGARVAVYVFSNEKSASIYKREYYSWDPNVGTRKYPVFADLNSDGHIDIAWAGNSAVSAVYYNGIIMNRENGFDAQPRAQWNSIESYAMAIGDVDGDGDLDVVSGGGADSRGLKNRLFLNDASHDIVDVYPAWESATEYATLKVVLGDLDSDGDLDLLCGNSSFGLDLGANTLYLNQSSAGDTTVFNLEPDHVYAPGYSHTLALGDVDGDGDLDLVSARRDSCILRHNRFNEGDPWLEKIFDDTPAWAISLNDAPTGAALGDVDGDGDLDLVIGTDYPGFNQLFLNSGDPDYFGDSAVWEFEDGSQNETMALSDVDGDGDLDLLTSNNRADQGANLYLNLSPVFEEAPREPMQLSEETWSLALGDINGDGHIDLICGNDGSTRLYLNTPSWPDHFMPVSQWNNQFAAATRDVALADVNGNGTLDLICGNYNQANTLFENTGDSFNLIPDWYSDPAEPTTSVAVGDVSGNGYPDIVCGNFDAANRMYRNVGGTVETFPNWYSSEANKTRSVALGDVDNDGDLDLVCGNEDQSNTLFLNEAGRLADLPTWRSRPDVNDNATWSVALGDVDGDGYLDLVCGNQGQGNTLYINGNGVLPEDPAWTSLDADSTRCVELHDVDGDGDLDLLCGNYNAPNTMYLNIGGIFTREPVWQSTDSKLTTAVTAGDLDNDGDWDLVCGNQGEVNGLHFGRRNPVYQGDPANPTHHLPHSPTYLEDVTVQQPAANHYRVQMTAFDIESDPLWLLPRYRYQDESAWRPVGDGTPLGPFEASPEGSPAKFDWDVSTLAIDQREVILGLYAINIPNSVGIIRQNTSFHVDMGPLNVSRPQVAVAPGTLVFPGVTVGDTVEATLSVTNTGNEVLNVANVALPSAEMWLAEAASFTVPAGGTNERTVLLGPRAELTITGDVVISSDAPLTPEVTIPIEMLIRPLACDTRALLEGDTAPLGEALTIQVIPDEDVELERSALHYCPASANAEMITIEMTPQGRSFIGVIPGIGVTEAGLLYFIELENSGVFATDPADTSGGNFFALAVEAPQQVLSQAQPTSGSDFLAGREIPVFVTLAEGTVFESGTLNYRRGGEVDYQSVPVQEAELLLSAVIPDSVVGPRGVEYWIEILTSTSALADPPSNPAGSPHTIGVRVADLAEPDAHVGFQYRMVSVPLDFGVDFTGTLESLLADQSAFGPYPAEPYEQGQWRCFRGFPPDGDYLELPAGSTDDFRVQPGRGFWLISRAENWIATSPVAGTSTPTAGAFDITLAPGWNMVGHPFVFPVAWGEVLVDSQQPGIADIEGPWSYDGSNYVDLSALDAPLLEPFAGYWIHNSTDPGEDLILSIPPRASSAATAASKYMAATRSTGLGLDEDVSSEDILWLMTITASCAGGQDGVNRIGVIAGASDTWDRYDRCEPPPVPEKSISLYFPHASWQARQGRYTVDIRPRAASQVEGHVWRFDVAKDFAVEGTGDRVQLEFTEPSSIPGDLEVLLVDCAMLRRMDLREQQTYSFYLGRAGYIAHEVSARFELLVGTAEFLAEHTDDLPDQPTRTALYQNRPNPFNPVTVIRYDIAQSGDTNLRIYDVSGALVADLQSGHHAPGRYEVAWRGEDNLGHRVASGVYFFQLATSDGHRETRKLLLMK